MPGGLLSLLLLGAAAHTPRCDTPIDLPAGPLDRAVTVLARQSGQDIGLSDPQLARIRVSSVKGCLTPRQALRRLLRDSGAVAQPLSGGWRIEWAPRKRHVATRPAPDLSPPSPRPAPDILVTGSKRNLLLSSYAGTVSVLDAAQLSLGGESADSSSIVAHDASLGSTHFGSGRNKLFVRGIIDSGFVGPSQSTTSQYLNDSRLNYNAPDPNLLLYDISSVEVMEGPQGTLYGAGALGGVIRIVTRRPEVDRFSAEISGGASQVAHGDLGGDLAGMLNLPVTRGSSALRLVGYARRDGGYIDDPRLGRDINAVGTIGGRAALRILMGSWTVDLGGVLQHIDGDDSQWTDGDGAPLTRDSALALPYRDDYRLADLTISRQWGATHLVSSLAWSDQRLIEHFDATGATGSATTSADDDKPLTVRQNAHSIMLAMETRLYRQSANGSGWLLGISLLDSRSRLKRSDLSNSNANVFEIEDETVREQVYNRLSEATAYGEGSLTLPAGLLATAGLRFTLSRRQGDMKALYFGSTVGLPSFPITAQGTHSEMHILPSFALSAHPARNLLLFADYRQGFRPGGYGLSEYRRRTYEGDDLQALEIGARMGMPTSPLQLSLSATISWWRNILAEVVTRAGDPVTTNIGDGRIYSLEARLIWRPRNDLTMNVGLLFNHSRLVDTPYISTELGDGSLPNVSPLGVQASIQYHASLRRGLNFDLSAGARYFGGSRIGTGPLLDAVQGDYVDDHLAARVGNARYGVTLSIQNLFDGDANRFALGTPYRIRMLQETPQVPRTIRLGFDARL